MAKKRFYITNLDEKFDPAGAWANNFSTEEAAIEKCEEMISLESDFFRTSECNYDKSDDDIYDEAAEAWDVVEQE